MNAEKIKELRGLVAAATPGEWRTAAKCDFNDEWEICDCGGPSDDGGKVKVVADQQDYCMAAEDDAALIVAAVNALPALLDEVEALTSRAERTETALKAWDRWNYEVQSAKENGESVYSYAELKEMRETADTLTQQALAARHEPKDAER